MSAIEPISVDPVARLAEQQNWIAPQFEIAVQQSVRNAFAALGGAGNKIRDALHGTWLHEPVHAVLTDLPVGAWTAAVVFDAIAAVTDNGRLDAAADASVVVGLFGAAGAAITGINDWAEVHEQAPRRIGAVHGLLNVGATSLFFASSMCRRKRRSRNLGRMLAAIGYLVVSASAHLGGNLVYEHGIGLEPDYGAPPESWRNGETGTLV
jgi:uncharacterized membrane protein